MANRRYKRDRNGRFASSGTAVTTTVGRAGGFANAGHRQRTLQARQQPRPVRRGLSAATKRRILVGAQVGIAVGARYAVHRALAGEAQRRLANGRRMSDPSGSRQLRGLDATLKAAGVKGNAAEFKRQAMVRTALNNSQFRVSSSGVAQRGRRV